MVEGLVARKTLAGLAALRPGSGRPEQRRGASGLASRRPLARSSTAASPGGHPAPGHPRDAAPSIRRRARRGCAPAGHGEVRRAPRRCSGLPERSRRERACARSRNRLKERQGIETRRGGRRHEAGGNDRSAMAAARDGEPTRRVCRQPVALAPIGPSTKLRVVPSKVEGRQAQGVPSLSRGGANPRRARPPPAES